MALTVEARPPRSVSTTTLVLVAISLAAWAGTIAWVAALDMELGAGTMGLGVAEFIAMWTLMMTAMMLPAIAPMVSLYSRSVKAAPLPLTTFALGYLLVWAVSGVMAYALTTVFGDLATDRPGVAHAVAVVTFVLCGLYQLTPLKQWCLRHCRSPIGHLVHYASFSGPTRHLRAGAHHGTLCVGCCWALMVALLAVGMMNIPAMVALALVVTLEKQWRHGERLARVVGVAALLYAVAIAFSADLAPGLVDRGDMDMGPMDPMDMG